MSNIVSPASTPSVASDETQIPDLYRAVILEAASNPFRKGAQLGKDFPPTTTRIITGNQINASCGDAIAVEVLLSDQDEILDLVWTGNGCAISQASMSFLAESVIGQSITTVHQMNEQTLLDWLGLSEISISRKKCLLLGLNTLQHTLSRTGFHASQDE